MPAVTTEADRISLRPVAPEDCGRFVALLNEWDVVKNLSQLPHPYTVDDFAAFQAKQAKGFSEGSDFAFAIHVGGAGVIGCIGLHRREDGQFEMGYWIGKPYWGQGFATEAGHALLAWFRARQPEAQVKASHFEDNPNSGRVLRKLGFRYTGEILRLRCAARDETVASRAVVYAPDALDNADWKERP